jgi:hypothetical protein
MRIAAILILVLLGAGLLGYYAIQSNRTSPETSVPKRLAYHPREPGDTSGFQVVLASVPEARDYTSFEETRLAYSALGYGRIKKLEASGASGFAPEMELKVLFTKALLYAYEGDAREVCRLLQEARKRVESSDELA